MKTLLSTAAVLALLATPVAAQETMQPQSEPLPETQMQPEPAQPAPMTAPEASGAPMDLQQPQDSAGAAAIDLPTFIDAQEEGQILASELIGASVSGPDDAALGDVVDIIHDSDQRIVALVVGVGGFLGIGEKQVAVSLPQFTIDQDADANVRLGLDVTAEELEAATEFTSLEEARAAAEAERVQEQATPPQAPQAQ